MTNIVVTGGAGYIGSHACKALSQAGFTPIAVDNLSRGFRDAVRWGPLEQVDIADRNAMADVFRRHRPAAVMHFAAFAYVGESVSDPLLYYRNNTLGSLALIEAMVAAGVDRLVFSSTCATYGPPQSLPIDESHPQAPINPYGASKLMVERIIKDAEAAGGLRSVILRYFNAAGADPDGEIGENHDPETHLIPLAIDAALGRVKALTVFGDDYDTRDGTCIRDYIHVTDLADAHVRALRHLLDGGEPLILNLGNGNGFTVREVIAATEAATGSRVPVTMGPRRAGDPAQLVADNTRARTILGWEPERPDLITQVEHAWRWRTRKNA